MRRCRTNEYVVENRPIDLMNKAGLKLFRNGEETSLLKPYDKELTRFEILIIILPVHSISIFTNVTHMCSTFYCTC